MNAGRYVGASAVVFIVRTVLNAVFYGYLMHGEYESLSAAHPGIFREVVPAYVAIDLAAGLLLTYLVVKAASAFGGGVRGGARVGIFLALLGPVLFGLYYAFSVTFYTPKSFAIESIYQVATYALQGAIAAAIYKNV